MDDKQTGPDSHGRDKSTASAVVQNSIIYLNDDSLIAGLTDPDASPLSLLADTA
jgi:hypothetical protein